MKHGLNLKPSARFARCLILGFVCLGLLNAEADSLYRKSPRLAPRDRETTPTASPLLNWKNDVPPDDSRIHQESPPTLEAGFVPVSVQAENPVNPAPMVSPKPQATQSAKPVPPKTPEPKASKPQHPVVVRPVGSELEESAATPMVVVVEAPATPQENHSKEIKILNARVKTETKQSEKPLVYFPEDLKTTNKKKIAREKGFERGFYPVGFRPYVPGLSSTKLGGHETALLHYNRGSYYGHTSQLDEAIREYRQAIRENPELADAYVGLSSVYLFKSYWEEVFLNAEKALSLKAGFVDPVNITQARYNLSTAYCAAADYGKAKKFYQMVKAADHPQGDALWRYLQKNCKP